MKRLFLRGDYQQAWQLADEVLRWKPELDDIRFLAAQCSARNGEAPLAFRYLNSLTAGEGPFQLKASLLEAELAAESLFDLARAESVYQIALQIDPESIQAREGLVRLFATCGRRREAIPHLLKLVQLKSGSDLLTIAARGSGAINDIELLQQSIKACPTHSGTLLGLAMHAARSDNLPTAIELCQTAVSINPEFAPANVSLGEYLLQAARFTELEVWKDRLPDTCLAVPETWRVLGYLAEHQGRRQQALENFLQASRLGPDLKDVYFRISQLLQFAGDGAMAEQFANRLKQIQQLESFQDRMFQSGLSEVSGLVAVVNAFRDVGRVWEAYGWAMMGLAEQPNNQLLQALSVELAGQAAQLPLQLEAPSFNLAARLSAGDYSVADVSSRGDSAAVQASSAASSMISFRNDAAAIGLSFEFHPGVVGPTTHRMFEFSGGGIGVCDFDLDDYPDLFCSQGGLWETRGQGSDGSDLLFRNMRGVSYTNVASNAGISDVMFGQGAAVGDIDGDGFPDIFVSNIGDNQLWGNNGDGTFSRHALPASVAPNEWTTSALIADLNNDGAADIFAANYLTSDDVYDRICTNESGSPAACIPTHFNGVRDLLYVNDSEGAFVDESAKLSAMDAGKGLGVAAFSPAGDGRLVVMVSNDTTPNMLLSAEEDGSWIDRGFASGVAVNGRGKSEGCMGIAVGDVNDDGVFELFVTNFYNESNTFYHGINGQVFEDRTALVDLADVSMPQLGFGTQFVDADLDGVLEVVVANGHVDDLRDSGKPYAMPAQLFRQQQGKFSLLPANRLGSYFQTDHIGRSVVCLDWNVDGLPDLAIGHLHEPYALLTNTSVDTGKGVAVRFVGVASSRDAIGVTVSYELDGRTITRQLTAGDGYQASNQHELWLGCGTMDEVKSLTVVWPSGHRQIVANIPAGCRCVVRENPGDCFLLP